MKNKEISVETPSGEGVIESLGVSDLNYLMVRVRYPGKQWINYNVGKVDELLDLINIKIKNEEKNYQAI